MKKLCLLLVFAISSVAAYPSDNSNTLTVKGDFLSEKHVHYDVYKVVDATNVEVECGRNLRSFDITLETGSLYLIKFISKDGQTKYLYVDAVESGEFQVDVDFDLEGSAKLGYSKKKRDYYLLSVQSEDLVSSK